MDIGFIQELYLTFHSKGEKMSDIIRVGYIAAINYKEGTAQVVYKDRDNSTSSYMPLWSSEYNMPEIDTLVYVIHLPNSSTRGMILIPPYTNKNRPTEGEKGIWRKDFRDGSYIRYDYKEKKLEIVSSCISLSSLQVTGDLNVDGKIIAKTIETSGNVHIKGNLMVDGNYPS